MLAENWIPSQVADLCSPLSRRGEAHSSFGPIPAQPDALEGAPGSLADRPGALMPDPGSGRASLARGRAQRKCAAALPYHVRHPDRASKAPPVGRSLESLRPQARRLTGGSGVLATPESTAWRSVTSRPRAGVQPDGAAPGKARSQSTRRLRGSRWRGGLRPAPGRASSRT